MRILQVAPPWFEVPPRRYGGIELVVSALTEELVARGHDVTLLASGGSATRGRLVTVFDVPPSTELGDPVVELTHVTAIRDLRRYDLVHDHTLLGSVVAEARGQTAVVHTLHGPFTPRSTELLRRLARRIHLVAISHDQAHTAPDVAVRAVVHNGLDLARYGTAAGRGDRLLFLGRASPDKGPDVAIEVARRTGRPLVMAVKVNEPDEVAYWHDVVTPQLGRADVEVVPDADHETKVTLLQRAYAVVMPIRWPEPFGLVMAEAAACGTPVVAFARGAAPEIILDGETGRLVPPAEGLAGLAAAVEEVAGIAPERCVRHAADRFSAAAMTDGYLEVYRQALHRRPAPRSVPRRPTLAGNGPTVR